MSYKVYPSEIRSLDQEAIVNVHPGLSHCFAAVKLFNAAGVEVAASLVGSVVIEAKRLTNGRFAEVVNSPIDVSTPSEANWSGNVTQVKATPTGLAGTDATGYQLVVAQNES